MATRAFRAFQPIILAAGGLTLPAAVVAQTVRTLPETEIVGSADADDPTVTTLDAADLDQFQVETVEDLGFLAPYLQSVDSDSRGYGNVITLLASST